MLKYVPCLNMYIHIMKLIYMNVHGMYKTQ